MASTKPDWLAALEAPPASISSLDLSHVKTGSNSSSSGVTPLLPWDHMQSLLTILEANLSTLTELNLHSLRIGDVGLASLVDRILIKEACVISKLDLRFNAITAVGLRQAITKLSAFNYTIVQFLLEENSQSTAPSGSHTLSSISEDPSSSSTTPTKSRPNRPSNAEHSRKVSTGSSKDATSEGNREILNLNFQEIVSKYVAEFCNLNREAQNCIQGTSSHLNLNYTLKHPRLCPSRMAKLISSLLHVTSISLEGWTPPPPLTLKHQEKKLSKLTPEQIALKEQKRTVPGTLFASLPKLTELKLIRCVRRDTEKSKKGTLRGSIPSLFRSGKTAATKSTFVPTIPLEVGAMPCLRRLTMQDCGMEEISQAALVYMAHVEQIDFSMNEITLIPPQVSSLTNLTRLCLQSNLITQIPPEIASMRYLRELWLYDNLITKVSTDLAKWFPVMKDLRILNQKVEEGYVMDDPQLLEYRAQEEDLINSKSTIGCISFYGMLRSSLQSEIVLYKLKKKK